MEAASAQTVGAPTQRRRSRGIPERRLAKLMVAPSMILIAVVAAYPIIYAVWLSLHEYSVRQAGLSRWAGPVGLRNYQTALQSSEWWAAFRHTLIFTVSSVTLELVIGLGMALAMHAAFRGQGSCAPPCSSRGRCSRSSRRSCGRRCSCRRTAS